MVAATAFRLPEPLEPLDEQQTRIQLAACYRLIAQFGMTDLVYTHISARVPDEPEHFLINPYGMLFHEITASSLAKITHDGDLVEESHYPVNKAGFVIHSAIHMARPDVNCVLHTHTRAGIAISCMEPGLLPISQHAMLFHNRIAYHEYEGIAFDLEERERFVADLGEQRAMILRNHGLLTAGRSMPEAFELMYYLEVACKVQVDVMASRAEIHMPPQEVAERAAGQYESPLGMRSWPALLRLLDARDPGYRE